MLFILTGKNDNGGLVYSVLFYYFFSERAKREAVEDSPSLSSGNGHNTPQYRMPKDGVYLVVVHVWSPVPTQHFTASVHLEMQSPTSSGYLSITDYPLLPFYAVMCAVYVLLGLLWLVVCSLHWREILRLQFWIGGVILLGSL